MQDAVLSNITEEHQSKHFTEACADRSPYTNSSSTESLHILNSLFIHPLNSAYPSNLRSGVTNFPESPSLEDVSSVFPGPSA